MKQDSLCIVMPAYNEEDTIEAVVREWYPLLSEKAETSCFIVNCSGSTDGTVRILERMKGEFPKLIWLLDSENGYGPKVLDLYRAAVDSGAEYIFQTDSDGQTSPGEFEQFWTLRKNYDLIVGLRRKRGDGKLRSFVQQVESRVIRHYFHVDVPDGNTPFRLMNRLIAENYLEILPKDYSMPNILLTALCVTGRERVAFREISFGARKGGKNSMNLGKIMRIGVESLGTFREMGQRFARATPLEGAVETLRCLGPADGGKLLAWELAKKLGLRVPDEKTEIPYSVAERRFHTDKIREYLRFVYFFHTHRHLELDSPVTFCEKTQWLKLYDATPLKTALTDKVQAKKWIAQTVGEEYNIPLLGVWKSAEEIDYTALPESFALKTNHAQRTNLFIRDGKGPDREEIRKHVHGWLGRNYAFRSCELQYYNIVPSVFAEKCLPPYKSGSEEYKFLCTDGEIQVIYVFSKFTENGETKYTTALYSRNWEKLDWTTDADVDPTPFEEPAPDTLPEMIALAEKLSRGFAVVRVDLYDVGGKVYVGELTFTQSGGFCCFSSLARDIALGRQIRLPDLTPPPLPA